MLARALLICSSVDEIRLAEEINFTLSHFALVQFVLRVLIRRGDFVAP
jgi:hypothetical protein